MVPHLVPREPLSQVVFIHDYIRLVFQEAGFSIYNESELSSGTRLLRKGEFGFCDALVALIGAFVDAVTSSSEKALVLTFSEGTVFSVDRSGPGPEAWIFQTSGDPIVVEQNG